MRGKVFKSQTKIMQCLKPERLYGSSPEYKLLLLLYLAYQGGGFHGAAPRQGVGVVDAPAGGGEARVGGSGGRGRGEKDAYQY